MPKQPTAKTKKADWSRATRPHQVQNAQALVKRGKEAKRKKREQGRQFEDQSP
jgi:hypothetical protein